MDYQNRNISGWRKPVITIVAGLAGLVGCVGLVSGCNGENYLKIDTKTGVVKSRVYDKEGVKNYRIISKDGYVIFDTRKMTGFDDYSPYEDVTVKNLMNP